LNVNDNSGRITVAGYLPILRGLPLWVRRDWTGLYTGSGAYTSGTRFAFRAENYDNDNTNEGRGF